MLGTLMFCLKFAMEVLPNIHLVGVLTIVYTIVLRSKALIPLYLYVMLDGLFGGFSPWWYPYLYIWTILWAVTMFLPQKMSVKTACIVYPAVCALHGIAFGVLYSPAYAIIYDLNFEETINWVIAGLGFDITHFIGNLLAGILILPLAQLLKKLTKNMF